MTLVSSETSSQGSTPIRPQTVPQSLDVRRIWGSRCRRDYVEFLQQMNGGEGFVRRELPDGVARGRFDSVK
jgi:hypothetical protein